MNKKEQILKLVSEYIKEKHQKGRWKEGEDWIPYSGLWYEDEEYVSAVDTLLSEWNTFGPKARQFELEFAKLLGKKYGVYVNSGSSAILLMLAAAKSKNLYNFQPGDKIITPIVCFPTTLAPILQLGLKPVFVDVDIPSLNPNLDQIEEKLKKDASIKGLCFASVLGNPPDMNRVMKLVKKYNLVFFEDNCDGLGSTYNGKLLGSFGDMSTCSFFCAHHMSTFEGGFVATNNKKTYKILTSLRDWGRDCWCNSLVPGNVVEGTHCGSSRFRNWLPGLPDINFDHRYVFSEIGYNLKPLELQGAIGLEQIKKLPLMDQARRNNHKKLYNIFKKYEDYFHLPEPTKKSDPCWFAFLLTVKENAPFTRDELVKYLEDHKIQTRSYFSGNILAHPGYNHLVNDENKIENFPNANLSTSNSFFLGTYVGLTKEKINFINKIVNKFFNGKPFAWSRSKTLSED